MQIVTCQKLTNNQRYTVP